MLIGEIARLLPKGEWNSKRERLKRRA
jgi:hypothetical protein